MCCNFQKLQTACSNSINTIHLCFIALRATHIASAILQPMYLTYNRLYTIFAVKVILFSIGYNQKSGRYHNRPCSSSIKTHLKNFQLALTQIQNQPLKRNPSPILDQKDNSYDHNLLCEPQPMPH